MNHLPLELFLNIFDYLPNSSLIKCKMVCKKWDYYVDFYRIKSLTISKRKIDRNNLIQLNLSIKVDFKIFKEKLLIMKLFNDLRCLEIDCSNYNIDYLIYLTAFIKLEKLYLRTNLLIDSNSTIYLPNLKMLFIKFIDYDEETFSHQDNILYRIKIDCIKLEYLKFNGFSGYVDVVHPESIKILYRSFKDHQYFTTDDYIDENMIPHADTNLKEYRNLVELSCDDLDTFLEFGCLFDTPFLLKFNLILDDEFYDYRSHFKEKISELFDLKYDLKMDNLKIYINNEELCFPDNVDYFLLNLLSGSDISSDSE